jgi:hypothetical protein
MKTTILPEHPDAKSPAGADIRFVMACEAGNMIHSTVPVGCVNSSAVRICPFCSEIVFTHPTRLRRQQPDVIADEDMRQELLLCLDASEVDRELTEGLQSLRHAARVPISPKPEY